MGLSRAVVHFLVREHARRPFEAPVLLLGRQGVTTTLARARRMLEQAGLKPVSSGGDLHGGTNIPAWRGTWREKYASDEAVFRLLGLSDVHALDCSGYEGADIVWDLNKPVPPSLHERFALIVDGGTLEHVFDVRQSLASVVSMLRSGGRVVHISPANNFTNHGFYQFSPTLFFDYYGANRFVDLRCFVAEHRMHLAEERPWTFFEITPMTDRMTSRRPLNVVFVAQKGTDVPRDPVSPQQGLYRRPGEARVLGGREGSLRTWLARRLPERVKAQLVRTIPMIDPFRREWRARRWGRLG
jgi:hypothetical protein